MEVTRQVGSLVVPGRLGLPSLPSLPRWADWAFLHGEMGVAQRGESFYAAVRERAWDRVATAALSPPGPGPQCAGWFPSRLAPPMAPGGALRAHPLSPKEALDSFPLVLISHPTPRTLTPPVTP